MEEDKKQNEEKTTEEKKVAEQLKAEFKAEEKKEEARIEEKTEVKAEEKKKKGKMEKPRKTEAVVNGKDLPISTKHSMALCNFIKGKKADEAIFLLEEIVKMKIALPMKGEIPHRKGKIMSGRYPINATKQFLKLLKQLIANASVNGVEIEKAKIECKANLASRPYRRGGSEKFKRTHVTLKLKEKEEKALFGKETLERKDKEIQNKAKEKNKKQGEKK